MTTIAARIGFAAALVALQAMPALSAPSQDEAIEVASVTSPAAITVVAPSDPRELGTIYFGSREGTNFGGPR